MDNNKKLIIKKEENKLIEFYIDNFLSTIIKEENENLFSFTKSKYEIELIIRPECSQNCKYCYIAKYENELYPIDERVSNEVILNNLQLLLDYLIKNKILINFDLFSGDALFNEKLFFLILEKLYNYYNIIFVKEKRYFSLTDICGFISVSTNLPFIDDNEKIKQIKEWQEKFKKNKIILRFSASVDGKYLTQNRENKNYLEVDKYYEKVLQTISILNAGLHPMVSAIGVEKWIQNYDWWIENINKYTLIPQDMDKTPMMLEVRNNNWNKKSINEYLKLLNNIINYRLEQCNNSIPELTYHLFCGDGKNDTLKKTNSYDIIRLENYTGTDLMPCTLSTSLMITLNNLKIVPCHRMTYPQFAGGQFKVENNEITGIEAINPSGYIGLHTLNPNMNGKCFLCPISAVCMKGCYGAQFETYGDPLVTNNTVCDLFQAKIEFLIKKYHEMGILHEFIKGNYGDPEMKKIVIDLCEYYELKLEV